MVVHYKIKKEDLDSFHDLHPLLKPRFQTKIMSFYTYSCDDFRGLSSYLKSHGIEHLLTIPSTPQRVKSVERKHRKVVVTAQNLVSSSLLAIIFLEFYLSSSNLPHKPSNHSKITK